MRFTVPQFIEREAKILGPMTFKQTLYLGGGIIIAAILYLIAPRFIFIIGSVIAIGASVVLAFFKFSGRAMPLFVVNIFKFGLESKIYIWKKKEQPIITYRKQEKYHSAKKEKEELPLKIAEKSRLKKLHNEIETRTK